MIYRQGNLNDLKNLKNLALLSWTQYKKDLQPKYWNELHTTLTNENTYQKLLEQSYCLVCESEATEIIGMAYLVPNGNPTDIYHTEWSYIRFVSVHPEYEGQGIGRKLTEKCIEYAKKNSEQTVALHTSEIMNKARRLYENLGFKVLKEIEPRLGIKYWLYLLELDEAI